MELQAGCAGWCCLLGSLLSLQLVASLTGLAAVGCVRGYSRESWATRSHPLVGWAACVLVGFPEQQDGSPKVQVPLGSLPHVEYVPCECLAVAGAQLCSLGGGSKSQRQAQLQGVQRDPVCSCEECPSIRRFLHSPIDTVLRTLRMLCITCLLLGNQWPINLAA